MKSILTLLRQNRRINLWSLATVVPLTIVFAATLGTHRGYHKIYEDVGGGNILAVSEGNVACPYISLVPERYHQALLEIPNVVDVAGEVRQRFAYGKNKNLTLTGMDPAKLAAFKDLALDDTVLAAFAGTPNGALVGKKIAGFFDWKPGQEVRISGLVFKVAGVFEQPLSVYESMVFLHKDYLQQIASKQGFVTSMLVKTGLPPGPERERQVRAVEAVFADHPSTIVCRPENELWLAIKASQGNLGDIILALGIAIGLLLAVLHVNNALFAFKRKRAVLARWQQQAGQGRSVTALAGMETAAVSAAGGIAAAGLAWLGTIHHPYLGTDMFHPPIYIDAAVVGVVCAVSLLAGAVAGLAVVPAGRRIGAGRM